MLAYVLKRIFLIIPMMLVIIWVAFILFKSSGEDVVQSTLANKGLLTDDWFTLDYKEAYVKEAKTQGLDKPLFYGSIVPNYYPDNLHSLILPRRTLQAKDLLKDGADWTEVKTIYTIIDNLTSQPISKEHRHQITKIENTNTLHGLQTIASTISGDPLSTLGKHLSAMQSRKGVFFPSFRYHGSDNQFHRALSNIIVGNLGHSKIDGRPVTHVIAKALPWTMTMVIGALIMSVILGVALGIVMAIYNQKWLDTVLSTILYMIYAVPVFWLATMMVIFLTTDEYGKWTHVFPSVGINPVIIGQSPFRVVLSNLSRLWLPIFCITIHSLAYISRQMRSSILDEMSKGYFLTALSKGLSHRQALLRHAMPNALIPIVTLVVGAIPSAFAGSVVLEVIFNIPGMGRILLDAILGYDWSLISAILILVSFITLISYLLGDILYHWLNPKINLSQAS